MTNERNTSWKTSDFKLHEGEKLAYTEVFIPISLSISSCGLSREESDREKKGYTLRYMQHLLLNGTARNYVIL